MKQRLLFPIAFTFLAALQSAGLLAQPSECPGIDCFPGGTLSCYLATNWVVGLDLDGDGLAEFHQSRFVASPACSAAGVGQWIRDDTEALFPSNGTEMYMQLAPIPYGALREGERVLPAPTLEETGGVWWAWDPPETAGLLRSLGLGHTYRMSDQWPCPAPFNDCRRWGEVGLLAWTNRPCFGFRTPKPDGWHLGWVRIERVQRHQTADGRFTEVLLTDYDIQPQPNTEIRAGERVRPVLRAELAAGKATVYWATNFAGYTLERTRRLVSEAWEAALGVTNNAVTVEAHDGPWYFRLRR